MKKIDAIPIIHFPDGDFVRVQDVHELIDYFAQEFDELVNTLVLCNDYSLNYLSKFRCQLEREEVGQDGEISANEKSMG
jgi:hypothetical protein